MFRVVELLCDYRIDSETWFVRTTTVLQSTVPPVKIQVNWIRTELEELLSTVTHRCFVEIVLQVVLLCAASDVAILRGTRFISSVTKIWCYVN